jgi:rhodanese-related sulfurtransferase
MRMKFRELKLNKDPHCPLCGENPSIKNLIDYEEFCGVGINTAPDLDQAWEIQPLELKNAVDSGRKIKIIDVRQPQEYAIARLENSQLIPLANLEINLHQLDRNEEIIVLCRSGIRSAQAVKFLREAGFRHVKNLSGGILAWADEVDHSLVKY